LSAGQLDSFDDLVMSTLNNAAGVIYDNKYMLSIGDTTWVYDILDDKWSTWDMTFKRAVVYRNSADYSGLMGDSLFFIEQGKKYLYRYGGTNQDTLNDVTMTWKSAELMTDRGFDELSALGMWVTDDVPNGTYFNVQIISADQKDTTAAVTYDSTSFDDRYLEKQLPKNLSRYFQIQITTSGDTSGVGINGLEPIITKYGYGLRK